jgi:coproporphyrinogen III oxidase
MRERMHAYVLDLQDRICQALATLDGNQFREDCWERPGGGGGRSRVLQEGVVFEKAGVNVSAVQGELSPEAAKAMSGGKSVPEAAGLSFFATGISLVLHPWNPMAPTVHANYRYFERGGGTLPGSWWFGGGADLTPSYLFEEDAKHFHNVHKTACDAHDPAYYPRFKQWCDEYFRIVHRNETRGIGGIFFDDQNDRPQEEIFDFVKGCGDAFLPAYQPIVERRKDAAYTDQHKTWQQLRRGRYVEFNLVYDRGTTFGLRTGGRIESILMSLPLTARWEYDQHPAEGTPEEELLKVLRAPRSWG